jgi:alkanesulfonate monooxygenase SsuD/methylene tetrahydromethanopterin reductase-like flavin-dependent oxidoreductase (luciferase family)
MKLGLFMMPMHPPAKPHAAGYDTDLETLITADNLGYDEAWIGEHFTSAWENIPAPDLMIAAALQRTRNIRLGTGVNCLPNHNPAVLAHRIAQLDQMAKGRFNWGIGTGGFPGDFVLFDYTPEGGQNRQITRDAVDLVLQIWEAARRGDGAGLSSETERWKFTLPERADWGLWTHMVPYQQPHPPIAVAGLSAKSDTLIMAGERGWIPMSINFVPLPTLVSHWEAVAAGAAKTGARADRAEWRIARDVHVAETDAEARRQAREGAQAAVYEQYFLPLLRHVKQMSIFKSDPTLPDEAITIDWLMDNIWLVGSPETVEAKLRRLHADVGGFGGLLQLTYDWGDRQDQNERSMELLATQVIPRLADLA